MCKIIASDPPQGVAAGASSQSLPMVCVYADRFNVAAVGVKTHPDSNAEANAALIAAAPDMLAACRKVADYLNYPVGADLSNGCGAMTATICGQILRAAVAKAEGKG